MPWQDQTCWQKVKIVALTSCCRRPRPSASITSLTSDHPRVRRRLQWRSSIFLLVVIVVAGHPSSTTSSPSISSSASASSSSSVSATSSSSASTTFFFLTSSFSFGGGGLGGRACPTCLRQIGGRIKYVVSQVRTDDGIAHHVVKVVAPRNSNWTRLVPHSGFATLYRHS